MSVGISLTILCPDYCKYTADALETAHELSEEEDCVSSHLKAPMYGLAAASLSLLYAPVSVIRGGINCIKNLHDRKYVDAMTYFFLVGPLDALRCLIGAVVGVVSALYGFFVPHDYFSWPMYRPAVARVQQQNMQRQQVQFNQMMAHVQNRNVNQLPVVNAPNLGQILPANNQVEAENQEPMPVEND